MHEQRNRTWMEGYGMRLTAGRGKLRSWNTSKASDLASHAVQTSVLCSWPSNTSLTTDDCCDRARIHASSACYNMKTVNIVITLFCRSVYSTASQDVARIICSCQFDSMLHGGCIDMRITDTCRPVGSLCPFLTGL